MLLEMAWQHIHKGTEATDTDAARVNIGRAYGELWRRQTKKNPETLQHAVNLLQEAAEKALAHLDHRTASYALGFLGSLYEESSDGRSTLEATPQARHKAQQEYEDALQWTRMALGHAQHIYAPELLYRWQWQMGRLLTKMGLAQKAINAYERAVEILKSFRYEMAVSYGKPPDFRQAVGPVYFQLADLLLDRAKALEQQLQENTTPQYEHYLHRARTTIEQFKVAELQDYFQDECIQAFQDKEKSIEEIIDPKTMVIYPIILPNRTELLVSISTGLQRFSVSVSFNTLSKEVNKFRKLLEKRTTHQYQPHAERLYKWLIRPLESILTQSIETLVFVPDGILRTIPLGALYDGKQFLIERYAVSTLLGTTLNNPRAFPADNVRVLAAGLTESVQDFPPLEHVEQEIDFINQAYISKFLLNKNFISGNISQFIV